MSLLEWSGVVGNFAQVIGAIGVVVTLVYLSIQVKQNTEAIQCTNATTVQINFQNLARDLSTDRELSDVIVRAIKDKEDLTHGFSFHVRASADEIRVQDIGWRER